MTILFVILIIITATILGFIILVQNPKGGGLAGTLSGIGNQFMGVKQTTDVLEKGTWLFAGIIAILCLTSTVFISKTATSGEDKTEKISTAPIQAAPSPNNAATFPTAPVQKDTSK